MILGRKTIQGVVMVSMCLVATTGRARADDCNSNGIDDALDIASETSSDCNANAVPDDCDLQAPAIEEADLVAATGSDLDLGWRCDIDGNAAIVGSGSGHAYIYRHGPAGWLLEAAFTGSDGFGESVAIRGDLAIVGAPDANVGSAFIYRFDGGAWSLEAEVDHSPYMYAGRFGFSVDIDDDVAIVGAPWDDPVGGSSGSAFVFHRVGGQWERESWIYASDGAANHEFGNSVAINQRMALVGAHKAFVGVSGTNGKVYVFEHGAGGWSEVDQLTGFGSGTGFFFGFAVAMRENLAVVTARGWRGYVFRFDGASWQPEAQLNSSDGTSDEYGWSAGIDGDVAIVGSYARDVGANETGAGYLFRHDGGGWTETGRLLGSAVVAGSRFGFSSAVSGGQIIVGAPHYPIDPSQPGAAFVFTMTDDCDGNQTLDVCDVAAGSAEDCNLNRAPDSCEIDSGGRIDCDTNGIPDECELDGADCNANGLLDSCDVTGGASPDCNANGVPDECELTGNDCNDNGIPDECDADCDASSVPDDCEIAAGTNLDCNANAVPDQCDIAGTTSTDCDANEVPDECDPDCNTNGIADTCDIAGETSGDCDGNGVPDECDGPLELEERFTAFDAEANKRFGHSVAISGDTAVIAAQDDTESCPQGCGAIYIYRFDGSAWQFVTKATAPGLQPFDNFGATVAVAGDVIAVGAPNYNGPACNTQGDFDCNIGAVYIFRRDDGPPETWTHVETLINPEPRLYDHFGTSVALHGYDLVVGAPFQYVDSCPTEPLGEPCSIGAAFIYQYLPGESVEWVLRASLRSPQPEYFAQFGSAVGVDGNRIVVGAPGEAVEGHDSAGCAYVYTRDPASSNGWTVEARLVADDFDAGDAVGRAVAIDGGVIALGAPNDEQVDTLAGSAYVFALGTNGWAQEAKLIDAAGLRFFRLGESIAVSGDVVFVGESQASVLAPGTSTPLSTAGKVLAFRRMPPDWVQFATLTADVPQASARFGWSLALSDRLGLISAASHDDQFNNDGVGFLFNLRDDCNGNGRMDRCDIAHGTSADADANRIPDECDADCDANGQPDGLEADFDCDGFIDTCDDDSDNDGVANAGDACPTWPLGSRVNPSGGPMGDADDDCAITLADYAAFVDCLNGPGAAPPVGECLGVFDFDDEGDVDLADYGEMTRQN